MILAVKYTIKGVKKGHKKYKEHQAEKERKLLEERGQLPDLQDPSRELDVSCLASPDIKRQRSRSSSSGDSSRSATSAEKALENDPAFREYMERHRSLYLQQHRDSGLPPSYDSAIQQHLTPVASTHHRSSMELSSTTSHCNCHDCVASNRHGVSSGVVAEAPVTHDSQTLLHQQPQSYPNELPASSGKGVSMPVEADSNPILFELPGNLPAILPDLKEKRPSELPAQAT